MKGRVRQPNPYFISESNGCGSFGYQVSFYLKYCILFY